MQETLTTHRDTAPAPLRMGKRNPAIPYAHRRLAFSVLVTVSVAVSLGSQRTGAAPPALGASDGTAQNDGTERFPHDDAVLLRLAQHWTLEREGTIRFREQWAVKLRDTRSLDRFADPRISHLRGDDQLIIHEAGTVLPDGSFLGVPEYSRNFAATDALAGWPEYARWQDMIVSFSGIEPGVVLKLDYEIVSPAGTSPWLDGLVRLNDLFPIVERSVSVSVPDGTPLHYQVEAGNEARVAMEEQSTGGVHTFRWSTSNLAGEREEPLAPPWTTRSPRLRFTTCANTSEWVSTLLSALDRAAVGNPDVEAFARAAVEKEAAPVEQVRKVAAKLRDTFNFVESPKALRRLSCRDARAVLKANYGNGLEAGALLLTALRSMGFKTSALVAVKPDEWTETGEIGPVLSSFDAAVVQVSLPEGTLYIHPRLGEIKNPGAWGRRFLLRTNDGRLDTLYVAARGESMTSDVQVTGKLSLAKDGNESGELRLQATGTFYDPEKLQTADAQKAWVAAIVGQVLSGVDVTAFTIGTLSGDMLRATVQVATTKPLPKVGGRTVVRFGDGPCLLSSIAIPLDRSERFADVRLGTRMRESIDLTIEFPDGFKTVTSPESLEPISGSWGTALQRVHTSDRSLRFTRTLATEKETLAAAEFLALRETLNTLRATRHLTAAVSE